MSALGGGVRRLVNRVRRSRRLRIGAAATLALVIAAAIWVRVGPIPPALLDDRASTSTAVVDRNGVPLYEALSGDGTRSIKVTAATLPDALVAATLAAED